MVSVVYFKNVTRHARWSSCFLFSCFQEVVCCFAAVFNVRFCVVPEQSVLFGETEIENKVTEREQAILGSRFLRCC